MRGSKKTNPTVQPRTPKSRMWEDNATPGPQELYKHFVAHALDENMPQIDDLDDATRDILFDAVELAINVVCIAAEIAPTWEGLYDYVKQRLPQPA